MEAFPKNKIKPIKGELSGSDGDASIEILLEKFELEVEGYSEEVETSIRLDSIDIPTSPEVIEDKVFQFPVNPNVGYIDGSIYFFAAHNPVDVTKITFGKIKNGILPITLECKWVLEYERTGFSNFESKIEANIEL